MNWTLQNLPLLLLLLLLDHWTPWKPVATNLYFVSAQNFSRREVKKCTGSCSPPALLRKTQTTFSLGPFFLCYLWNIQEENDCEIDDSDWSRRLIALFHLFKSQLLKGQWVSSVFKKIISQELQVRHIHKKSVFLLNEKTGRRHPNTPNHLMERDWH